MKKYLLLLLTMLCVSIGTWADNVGQNGSTVTYDNNNATESSRYANFDIKDADDFPTWFATESATTILNGIPGENIKFKTQNDGYDNELEFSSITIGGSSTLTLTSTDRYNYNNPKATINIVNEDDLTTWINGGAKNMQLLNSIDPTKITITGEAPTISINDKTATLSTADGKLLISLGNTVTASDLTIWNSGVGANRFFSSASYRVEINENSYITISGGKATVHSNAEDDFATWIATSGKSELLAGLGVNSYAFVGAAKFVTSGTDNYIVLNETTATVTSADALTSLDTWMTTHTTYGVGNYLSDVNTYNMSSDVTTYLTNTTPFITATVDNDKKMVVTSSTVTVTKDIADFNSWRNTPNGMKILKGKTVEYVDCALKDNDNCTITLSNDGLTATVHATAAGHFKALYDANSTLFNTGTRFKFDNESMLNKEDLLCIMQGNKYYIDLYDITNGESTPMKIDDWTTDADNANTNNIDMILEAAVNDMVTNGYQARGILMPKNTGSGTSKMEKKNNNDQPTFTEYATYYRATSKTSAIYVYDMNTYYSPEYPVTTAQANFETTAAHLLDHIAQSDLDILIVGTSNANRINLRTKITENMMTEIQTTRDDMVLSGRGPADIYVKSKTAGDLKVATQATNIELTECNRLVVEGPVSATDITAVNTFTRAKALILKDATGLTASNFSELTNTTVEYIVLPAGWSKTDVSASTFSAAMTNLKAAISSTNNDLVAYIKEAGSLAEARYYATGGTKSTINVGGTNFSKFDPTVKGLRNVTLTGQLNASDLAANVGQGSVVNVEDGHLYSDASFNVTGLNTHIATDNGYTTASGKTAGSSALEGESIKYLDLADATFENQYDMNFNLLGLTALYETHLPKSSSMTILPIGCFKGNKDMDYLCIPSNYTTIGRYAVADNTVTCITTDNADHSLVVGAGGKTYLNDDAAETGCPYTFTFSQNVASIGEGAFAINNEVITDVYVLATTPPTCEVNSFSSGTTYGWGGFDGTLPYCREKYVNSGSKKYTVLHYPHKGTMTDAAYEDMEKKYTDITKIYTKKEQTGAVDANGRSILWPTLTEINRVYHQGTSGLTWYDWDTAYDGNQAVNDASTYNELFTKFFDADASKTYDFDDYKGWHQFVLTLATHIDRDETVVNNKIERNYVDAGWFTFCIPFDMTIGQVINMLGVPASDETYTNKLNGNDVGSSPVIPDIRQLRSVIRTNGDANHPNKVTFRLTTNLYNSGAPQYLTFNHDAAAGSVIRTTSAQAEGSVVGQENSTCLVGGHPYIIHVYKREGESIPKYNLGQYIMNHYADEFQQTASCINNGNYEWLGDGTKETLKFAKPFEDHKIQAAADADPSTGYALDQWLTYDDGGTARKYHYAFVGQFWEQPLPRYCFYQSKGTWYRNSTVNEYKWSPYKCVIMAVPFVTDSYTKSGKYRDESRSQRPIISGTDLLDKELKIGFADGRNDDDFVASARYSFAFDDDIVEYDDMGNEATAIDKLDGEDITPLPNNYKVYNMSGQYVGNSVNGLAKGMYVVNGKKYVIK